MLDLTQWDDWSGKQSAIGDYLYGTVVSPWTRAEVTLTDGRSVAGTKPQLATIIFDLLQRPDGTHPQDAQILTMNLPEDPGTAYHLFLGDIASVSVG